MPLAAGQILQKRYLIDQLLGRGGFGAVYKAFDTSLQKYCAVKENSDISEAAQRQFHREAVILARLRHPNLPGVIDHFIVPDQGQYLVMDYIAGEDLQEKLDRAAGPLPEAQVVAWIAQVCDALAYLHTRTPPIIHRDVKPKNIIITAEGRAILVDFGIAKVFDPQLKTTVGARAVTPGYSPLEQFGQGVTDARSDVYSLGATLWALLTGQTPPSITDVLTGKDYRPAALELNALVSPEVNATIEQAMQVDCDQRFGSAAELKAAMLLASAPTPPQPPEPTFSATMPGGQAPLIQTQPSTPGSFWGNPTVRIRLTIACISLLALMACWWFIFNRLPGWLEGGLSEKNPPGRAPSVPIQAVTEMSNPATITPIPTFSAYATRVSTADGMMQVYVPAGEFKMGSPEEDPEAREDEKPQHPVILNAYWIDQTEVTNSQYAACVQAAGCAPPRYSHSKTRGQYYDNPRYTDYPVVWVFWEDARKYCDWAGRRLPTEAEWEKAARGTDQRLYPWGNENPNCALANGYSECSKDTDAVGSYPDGASPYGALDMAGNVWEWVADWYGEDYYAHSLSSNPAGPPDGEARVLRGGGFYGGWDLIRAAFRSAHSDDTRGDDIGFRCAQTP